MALNTTINKPLPIGLDLGSSSVKLAQLRQAGAEIELLAGAQAPLPHSSDFRSRLSDATDAIRDLMQPGQFKGRQCIVSLPAEVTFLHHLKIAKVPESEIPAAIEWELRGKLPYPVDEAVIRHVVAGETFGDGERRQEVIVVAAQRSIINQVLASARKLRLDVTGINIEPCAIVECFARLFRRPTDAHRTVLYVDMGTTSTQVVLAHAQKIVFAKNLTFGGHQLDEAVAGGLNVETSQAAQIRRQLTEAGQVPPEAEAELYHLLDGPLERLSQELTQCMRYYDSVFRNHAVERVIFIGGQAYDKRFCQAVAQRLNLPAQIGDPLLRVNRAAGAGLEGNRPRPDWAVAVGLSLGANIAA